MFSQLLHHNYIPIMYTSLYSSTECTDWHLPHANSEVGNKLVNILEQNNLYQIVKEPTGYFDKGAHLLDLIITELPDLFLNSGVSAPFANLHHATIYGTLNFNLHQSKSFKRTVWDFKSADKGILNEAMAQAHGMYLVYSMTTKMK